jgi:hypothetical protein
MTKLFEFGKQDTGLRSFVAKNASQDDTVRREILRFAQDDKCFCFALANGPAGKMPALPRQPSFGPLVEELKKWQAVRMTSVFVCACQWPCRQDAGATKLRFVLRSGR